ncbi:MAG TPA: hypothetical protein VK492_20145 [Chitinophagaceae bacterium]|nr:hypothetical protein [Chitinophagaceae bacterium]
MTPQEFQRSVTKIDLYGKYLWYLFSIALIGIGVFLFYDLTTNPNKYRLKHTYVLAFFAFAFLFLLGCYALYLLPNRYKVLTVNNNLSIDKKKLIVDRLLDNLKVQCHNSQDIFYTFTYQRKPWTKDYDVYLGIDKEKFYVSVLVRTSYYRGGFIDFGGAERLRRKIVSSIKLLAGDE